MPDAELRLSELEDIIADLRREESRWDAILTLKFLQADALVPTLISYLENDDEWVVRWCVAEKLGEIRDPVAVPALMSALSDDDDHVQKNAAKALERFGTSIVPQLVAQFHSPFPWVRQKVLEILLRLGEVAIGPMEEALASADWVAANRIAHTIFSIGGPMAQQSLVRMLAFEMVQKQAIVMLGELQVTSAIPRLVALYNQAKLKRLIVHALQKMGPKQAYGEVVDIVAAGLAVAPRAEAIILKIGEPMLPYLMRVLLKACPQKDAIVGLAEKIGPKRIMPKVFELAEKNPVFRAATAGLRRRHPLGAGDAKPGFKFFN